MLAETSHGVEQPQTPIKTKVPILLWYNYNSKHNNFTNNYSGLLQHHKLQDAVTKHSRVHSIFYIDPAPIRPAQNLKLF